MEETDKEESTEAWREHVRGKTGGCGKGTYSFAKGPIGFIESPEGEETNGGEGEGQAPEHDDGDLENEIFTTARTAHEKIIHVGLAGTVSTKDKAQGIEDNSRLLGIQEAVEKEADFWGDLWV